MHEVARLDQQGALVPWLQAFEEDEIVERQLDLVGVEHVEKHDVVAPGAQLAQPVDQSPARGRAFAGIVFAIEKIREDENQTALAADFPDEIEGATSVGRARRLQVFEGRQELAGLTRSRGGWQQCPRIVGEGQKSGGVAL